MFRLGLAIQELIDSDSDYMILLLLGILWHVDGVRGCDFRLVLSIL